MKDITRYTLGFFGGAIIGIVTVMFIWGVTDCEYAPQYGASID